MSDQPLVSVVTPSYNQVRFIEETICSVLQQDYPYVEYIIMDGGSTDGSVDIIRRYADRLAFWVSEPDHGQAHAINKGLRQATGDILGWLNSDDVLVPDAVSRVVAYLECAPDVEMVYGRADWIDEHSQPLRRARTGRHHPEFGLDTVIDECVVTQPGAFWRRRIMDQIGLLDENLHYVMDYEYWVRMALAGAIIRRLPEPPVAHFRLSTGSKTASQFDKSGLEMLSVLDQLMLDPDLARKLAITPDILHRREQRARALASLKVFQIYARRKGKRSDALRWLGKASRHHLPTVWSRWRVLATSLRDSVRIQFGR